MLSGLPPTYIQRDSSPLLSPIDEKTRAIVPTFTLECGFVMTNVPVAYKTWGRLSSSGDNVMVICHGLSDDTNVERWWAPLFGGHGRAIDITRFFVICMNSLGSPYGTASPRTAHNPNHKWGPEFPPTTIRDDVRLHKLILDRMGITQIAVVMGGSMGGMLVLEWAFFGAAYVRTFIPIATAAQTSAWCIGWGETQRQSIFSDSQYRHGYYPPHQQPRQGLAAARMTALLVSRSRDFYESKFSRRGTYTVDVPGRLEMHTQVEPKDDVNFGVDSWEGEGELQRNDTYLRHEAERFVSRFDANCYIALTRKVDTHDIARGRFENTAAALSVLTQPALVIGITSDGLYPLAEQRELAEGLPYCRLAVIDTDAGHSGFLMPSTAVDIMNDVIVKFLGDVL